MVDIIVAYTSDSQKEGTSVYALLKRYEQQLKIHVVDYNEIRTTDLNEWINSQTTVILVQAREIDDKGLNRLELEDIVRATTRLQACIFPVYVDFTPQGPGLSSVQPDQCTDIDEGSLTPITIRSDVLEKAELGTLLVSRIRNRQIFIKLKDQPVGTQDGKGGDDGQFVVSQPQAETGSFEKAYVFVSAASEDYACANLFHRYLRDELRIRSFFADEAVRRLGDAEYFRRIVEELDRATHLVVITSREENVLKKWVAYEWTTFISERLAGRKPGHEIGLYVGDHPPSSDRMHLALRRIQWEPCDPDRFKSYKNYFSLPPGKQEKEPDTKDPGSQQTSPSIQPIPITTVPVPSITSTAPIPGRTFPKWTVMLLGILVIAAFAAVAWIAMNPPWLPDPGESHNSPIQITTFPPAGSNAQVSGSVAPAYIRDHKILAYVKVDGKWWGPKPTWDEPFTLIEKDGSWRCTVFTGGNDISASEIAVVLVPADMTSPPRADGRSQLLPVDLNSYPYTTVLR